jgi:hypothetical protein
VKAIDNPSVVEALKFGAENPTARIRARRSHEMPGDGPTLSVYDFERFARVHMMGLGEDVIVERCWVPS